jgi:hypothetical protein
MSSYASYCEDQGIDCARRARLARSLEVATYWRSLGFRWLRLAEQTQRTGGALGHASGEVDTSSFRFSDLDLERETTHAKANEDARSRAQSMLGKSETVVRGEQLWGFCNTLKIFKQRHIAGRIA